MILDIYQYSCGSKFEELKVTDSDRAPRVNALLEKVFVRGNIVCNSDMEIPYFSSESFPPVCYFCASKDELKIEDGTYPYCAPCGTQRPLPSKRKHNLWKEKQSKKQKK